MLIIFYVLAALLIIQGLLSLREGFKFLYFARKELNRPIGNYTPFVTIIAPCKGIDLGFRDNIAALFTQNYPDYEIIFVVEDSNDPATSELPTLINQRPAKARLVIAGRSNQNGQKVHNLLRGLADASDKSEVFVFVDSDARPHRDWLRQLVAPLGSGDKEIGATTGYRWYLPVRRNLSGIFLSLWNGSVATSLGPHKRNFAWGGSMAVKRATFEELKITEAWQGIVSDDFAVTNAVKRAGKYVRFVPQCLIVSYEDCSFAQLLEFTTRQMIITRVYSPDIWRLAWVAHILFNTTFYFGIAFTIYRFTHVQSVFWPVILLAVIYFLGAWKGWLRYRAISLLRPDHQHELRQLAWAYVLLPAFSSLLWLYNLIASASTRRITWRGITYELRSRKETIIISRP
ncbi:MAG TPA: glycosyltransferase [Blastocatellia bacterium]|nr:glycosyltransferase [Blastocatellia bacterium]